MEMLKIKILLWLIVGQHLVTSTTWINELTKYIAEDPDYPLVNLVTNVENRDREKSGVVEKLMNNLMRSKLCVRVNLNKTLDDIVDPEALKVTDSSYIISATATFFVLIHDTVDNSSTQKIKMLVDAAAKMSTFQYRPKFLLVSKVLSPSENLTVLLSYAWSLKMLDFTIVEFMEQKLPGMQMWKQLDNATPTVHQFNPFKRKCKKMEWPRNMEDLFPNKLTNLQGYELNVVNLNDKLNSLSPVTNGYETLMFALLKKMNATRTYEILKIPDNVTSSENYFDWMMKNEIDISNEATGPFTFHRNVSLRTTTVAIDSYCAFVPTIYQVHTFINMKMFAACIITFIIILMYRLIAKIFKFDKASWTMFYIIRLFFGISVSRVPTKMSERIIFTSLIILCVLYSSNIYTAITDAILNIISETPFNSFEDLDNSGLTPVVHSLSLNKTFSDDSTILLSLKKKAVTYGSRNNFFERNCIINLVNYENISCFMSRKLEDEMQIFASVSQRKLKVAEPCFFMEPRSFILGHRSPYRWVFDQLILRLQSSGIDGSMNNLCLRKICEKKFYSHFEYMYRKKSFISPLSKDLMQVTIAGWILSTIVFVSEILWYRLNHVFLSRFR